MQLTQTTAAPSAPNVPTTDLDVVVLSDEDLACATGGVTIGPGNGWTEGFLGGPGGGW